MEKNRLNVLLVSPLVSNVAGGIAKWTRNICSYYDGLESTSVNLLPCYNEKLESTLSDDGFCKRIKNGISNYLPLIRKIKKTLKQRDIDVIHISTSGSIGLIKDITIIRLAKRKNIRCVVHFHFGRIPTIFKKQNWEMRLIEKVISASDKIVVMDMASYKVLKKQGYNHVSYIPNPLSLDTQFFVEKSEDINRVPNKIVFVGQMLETKGIFELAQACEQIAKVRVYFIGPLQNKETIDKLKTLIAPDKLVICGTMPFEQVIKEMKSASVFVLPTYTEGFPNVIIESMACGCSIVTTPVGAIPDMLDIKGMGKCGICVPVKDVEGLRTAISFMLKNPREAASMGERAKERVYNEYSIQKVWNELVTVWK